MYKGGKIDGALRSFFYSPTHIYSSNLHFFTATGVNRFLDAFSDYFYPFLIFFFNDFLPFSFSDNFITFLSDKILGFSTDYE